MEQRAIPGDAGARPRLSVVMPVRDLAPYVEDSIRSILDQSFTDFELVILDDGSTDGTRKILRAWQARDSRIRLFEGAEPLGPALSSNFVVARARGEIVARMDGDDIAHPDRLRRQIDALDADPEACLVGTLWEGIDEKGRRVRPRDRWRLVHASPFAPFPHGSIMFRRTAFEQAGCYRTEADFWEDLDLYRRMARIGGLIVLPQVLYQHRASALSTRLTSARDIVEHSIDRMYRQAHGLGDAPRGTQILPRVFLSLGSTRIWAGHRPAILSRLLRRGALGLDLESVAILAWAAWGALSPRSLRFCLAAGVTLRDRRVRHLFADGAPWRWRPVSAPEPAAGQAIAALPPAAVAAG
ncbi:MAG TPA: glycosyltransferase family A protein [Allosphingosinicella sp.]